jgi:O-acetyl-ADP-ribose deacetylase (regulator of RNase III)
VIHTVGPVYRNGKSGESKLLSSCYKRCFEIASENGINSIAFPSISTGAYRYPMEDASRIALETVIKYLEVHSEIKLVRFVLFGADAFNIYKKTLYMMT